MDFHELIRIRRSIRAYRPDEIADDVLQRVLMAARVAPTACNLQPFQLLVITDAEVRAQMTAAYGKDWLGQAPVLIAICVLPDKAWKRRDGFSSADLDAAIVMDHIILAATEEGMGTCWICNFDEAKAKQILGVPADVRIVAMTPMGVPAAEPAPFVRKPLSELVRRNRW